MDNQNQDNWGWLVAGCLGLLLVCAVCLLLTGVGYALWPKGAPIVVAAPPIIVQQPPAQQPPAQQVQPPVQGVVPPVQQGQSGAPAVGCRVIHDYNLDPSMGEVATSGSAIHVEFWWEGVPEKETLLAGPVRYGLTRSLRGHVWEYALECTQTQVMEQINAHIVRRKAQGANNAGFVDATSTGLFRKVSP